MVTFDPPLDPGIERAVILLNQAGIETYESCDGGEGHSYLEPTIAFHGNATEFFRAFAIATENGLKVSAIRRFWSIIDGEPTGPTWEITFWEEQAR